MAVQRIVSSSLPQWSRGADQLYFFGLRPKADLVNQVNTFIDSDQQSLDVRLKNSLVALALPLGFTGLGWG